MENKQAPIDSVGRITLTTQINAPVQRCFDCARSIDVHVRSMENSREKAIDGRRSGLIELDEWVTWEASHFGIKFRLTSKITSMTEPHSFVDEMQKGPFKFMHHRHEFTANETGCIMVDHFDFQSPFGLLGKLIDSVFLTAYMKRSLEVRNAIVKKEAESTS